MPHRSCLFLCVLLSALGAPATRAAEPQLERSELGTTRNVHRFGKSLLCGQPSAEEFAEAKQRGIKVVVTLRMPGEVRWDEEAAVKGLGLEFHRISFAGPDTLKDDIFDRSLKVLAGNQTKPVMLHCGSANRVGAIWLAHRVLNDGLAVEAARVEARQVGLRTAGYEDAALAYIASRQRELSVRPGINDRFLDPQLAIDEWVGRFEVESREVFVARQAVLEACGVQPGQRVADIGAGTGLYSRLFAEAVGTDGWVFAVDISPRFLQHINQKFQETDAANVTTILGSDRSTRLPPESVDLVFICDTYHHFEYPRSTLASIHKALRPGGSLVVIDFNRIPGESREFILGHVRAGKEVFRAEIEQAGFKHLDEVEIPAFKENYLLRFSK